MQVTISGIINTLLDLFALYIATLLLKCTTITKWVVWTYIILHVVSLISDIYVMFEPIQTTTTSTTNSNPGITTTQGILLVLILLISVAVFVIDVYVLYKMYKCENVDKKLFWFFLASVIIGGIVKSFLHNK